MIDVAALSRRTERLLLRPLVAADEEAFLHMVRVSRTHWAPWMPAREGGATDQDTFTRELQRGADGAAAGTHARLAGFLSDGALAGLFSLNEIVRGVFQCAYAGWSVSADRVGRGLGTEGVRALLDVAFDPAPEGLGLHRVQANIIPSNAASLRIAEKAGFRREGLAERYLKIAGSWQDHVMFAMTREERTPPGTR